MKATLYEALGILPTSSDEEVRAALRRVIRKYYAKTRDGQGIRRGDHCGEAVIRRGGGYCERILADQEHSFDAQHGARLLGNRLVR